MLGFYENFPIDIHKTLHYTVSVSKKRSQKTLAQILHKLNNKSFSLEEVAYPSVPQCIVVFEFGIAEANSFSYLDKEETDKVLKAMLKKSFQVMDFFCAIRYYKTTNRKKKPLKFDYYMLRFKFNKKSIEIQVFHERGPRHVSPEDLTNFIANKMNESSSKKMLRVPKAS